MINPPDERNLHAFLTSGPPLSAGDAARVLRHLFEQLPLELCRNAIRLPDGGAILLVQDGDAGRFMRFSKDWLPDLSYTNSLRARGYLSLALQADGKLLVGRGSELRDFTSPNALSVVRVNTDGSIDRSFKCETDERVVCLAVQPDAKVILGGYFQRVNGAPARWMARANADGSLDEAFQMHLQLPSVLMAGKRLVVNRLPIPSGAPTGCRGTFRSQTPPLAVE